MKKYIVVVPSYPSDTNPYSNAFVHARVKNYIAEGLSVEVFCVNRKTFAKSRHGKSYVYDSVTVTEGNVKDLYRKLREDSFEKVLVHFGLRKILSAIIRAVPSTPLIVWFHGVDIIAWYRRLYNLRWKNCIKFAGYAVLNTIQRGYLYWLMKTHGEYIHCVFVSNWLKNTAEKDIHRRGKISRYSIIPNIVDEKVFSYQPKAADDRLNILSIRSFISKNYANDLSVKAIHALSDRPFFNELSFTICGTGRLWNKTVKPLRKYPNVKLYNRVFTHTEIVTLHKAHGIMLMPSRQDTHGVSTCEGMSSGLVPVTSNNSAIPEYVPTTCGYLANNYLELANAIEDMYYSPDKFLVLSKKAAVYINSKCASSVIISKELHIITERNT